MGFFDNIQNKVEETVDDTVDKAKDVVEEETGVDVDKTVEETVDKAQDVADEAGDVVNEVSEGDVGGAVDEASDVPDAITDAGGSSGGGSSDGGSGSRPSGGSTTSSNINTGGGSDPVVSETFESTSPSTDDADNFGDGGSLPGGEVTVTELDEKGRAEKTKTFDNERKFEQSKFGDLDNQRPKQKLSPINPNANKLEQQRQRQKQKAQSTIRKAQFFNERLQAKEDFLENRRQTEKVEKNLGNVREAQKTNKNVIQENKEVKEKLSQDALKNITTREKQEELPSAQGTGIKPTDNVLVDTGTEIVGVSQDISEKIRKDDKFEENIQNSRFGQTFTDSIVRGRQGIQLLTGKDSLDNEAKANLALGGGDLETSLETQTEEEIANAMFSEPVEDAGAVIGGAGVFGELSLRGVDQQDIIQTTGPPGSRFAQLSTEGKLGEEELLTAASIGASRQIEALKRNPSEARQEVFSEIIGAGNPVSIPGVAATSAITSTNAAKTAGGKIKAAGKEVQALRKGSQVSKSAGQQIIESLAQNRVNQDTLQTVQVDTSPGTHTTPEFVQETGPTTNTETQSTVENLDTTGINFDTGVDTSTSASTQTPDTSLNIIGNEASVLSESPSKPESSVITKARNQAESNPLTESQSIATSQSETISDAFSLSTSQAQALSQSKTSPIKSVNTAVQTATQSSNTLISLEGENDNKNNEQSNGLFNIGGEPEAAPSVDAILTGSATDQKVEDDKLFTGFEQRKIDENFNFNLF